MNENLSKEELELLKALFEANEDIKWDIIIK